MTRTAEQTARSAELSMTHPAGMCLQWSRQRADIPPRYPDATTAWGHVNDKHYDRTIPRGAMAWWVGGSRGHGHVAVSLGGGAIRSTDAAGAGRVATKTLAWFDINWPSLIYQGWSWDINEQTIPHDEEEENGDMALTDEDLEKIRSIVAKEVAANNQPTSDTVWFEELTVTKPDGETEEKSTRQTLREIWQRVSKLVDKE